MCEVIEISQLEENTIAIDKALSSGSRVNAGPNATRKSEDSQKEKDKKAKEKEQEKEKDKEKKKREKKEEQKRKRKEKKERETKAEAEAETPASPAPSKGKGKGLLLSLYVDDILLSGPAKNHARFWDLLQKHLEIEEPSPVDRVLGGKHLLSHDADSTTLQHDMSDFCKNCCELYEQLAGRKLKEASTPFDVNIPVSDFEEKGLLAESASKILMKVLWCARLARPDLMKPISDLTRKVTCWSLADDKKLYKLMCYLHSTPKLSLTCKIADSMDDLYTDAEYIRFIARH
eukprot:s5314_g2.t1